MGAETSTRPPRGETRERILEVALELFNEQGYEKTSLREIAGRVGVTKAALYYYFERKEDILLEFHLRLHDLGRGILDELDRLGDEGTVAAWPDLVDQFIDQVLANRELFLVHQRNERAFQQLSDVERNRSENEDIAKRFRRFAANPAIPLDQRVRMASSIGVVVVALIGASDSFGEVSIDEIAQHVRGAVRDLFPKTA